MLGTSHSSRPGHTSRLPCGDHVEQHTELSVASQPRSQAKGKQIGSLSFPSTERGCRAAGCVWQGRGEDGMRRCRTSDMAVVGALTQAYQHHCPSAIEQAGDLLWLSFSDAETRTQRRFSCTKALWLLSEGAGASPQTPWLWGRGIEAEREVILGRTGQVEMSPAPRRLPYLLPAHIPLPIPGLSISSRCGVGKGGSERGAGCSCNRRGRGQEVSA